MMQQYNNRPDDYYNDTGSSSMSSNIHSYDVNKDYNIAQQLTATTTTTTIESTSKKKK